MGLTDSLERTVSSETRDPVTERMRGYFTSGSAIRRMFEEGLRLKAIHGSENVADLSIGNPAFPPPPAFDRALRAAARESGYHAYMPNAGYPWVRKKVASYLNLHGYFDGIRDDQIVMTTGAAGALNVVLSAILEPGDEVIVARPYFVEYKFYVELHGGILRIVNTGPDFEIDPSAIQRAISPRTRAVIVNSPNNPTGRVYRRETLKELAEVLLDDESETGRFIYLISDEPYRDLVFEGEPFSSPASAYPYSFMVYSWSKAFSIPGERIGYLAVNPKMRVTNWATVMGTFGMCNRIQGFINAPALMQRVVGSSLDAEIDIEHYRLKRDQLCDALTAAGYDFPTPEGAFYVFVRTPEPESEFISRAKQNLLLAVPGSGFGMEGYFRVCYAVPDATLSLACRKLVEIKRQIDES